MAAWLLRRFSQPPDMPGLTGDAEEEFQDRCLSAGGSKAKGWYWKQVAISLPAFLRSFYYWRLTMISNTIKVAFRNIRKHKAYAFINITGLAVGMACCLLILLWVRDEFSYDRFHHNADRLYRTIVNEEGSWWTSSPWALAPILEQDFPEIEKFTRIAQRDPSLTYQDTSLHKSVIFVDPEFFSMFTYPFIEGDSSTPFPIRNSIVISKSTARAFFGRDNPIGKVLNLNSQLDMPVAGVIEDPPFNSHLRFDAVASVQLVGKERLQTWGYESSTFLLLKEGADPDALNEKIAGVVMEHDRRVQTKRTLEIQPLTRIHLHALTGGGSIVYVYLFSTIALFILLIACINFMNLSTARAGKRSREVGLRKVMGAERSHVIRQFFGESLLMAGAALILALLLASVTLPGFNALAQKDLRIELGADLMIWPALLLITLFTGLVSGSYPALVLSAFRPVEVLKGGREVCTGSALFRKILVVLQFAIAVILMTGTLIIYKQIHYIRHKDLGFNRRHVLSLPINETVSSRYEALKTEIKGIPGVRSVTAATSRPTMVGNMNPVYWEGRGSDQYEPMRFITVDHDYIPTFEMEVVAGRNFSREFATDQENYIVNQAAVRLMRMEHPVGKIFSIWEDEGRIIGVVKDFHSRPMHSEIEPAVLTLRRNWGLDYLFVRIAPDRIHQTIGALEKTWKSFTGGLPFEYLFLDDHFDGLYRSDRRRGKILQTFTWLAIFISCLGIFGLSAFMVEQRTREIGIRKVLGASITGVMSMISREFMILLGIANLIAWPAAYFVMRSLLRSYSYRTGISIWIFFTAGAVSFVLALLTVIWQASRAARTDPSLALRHE